MDQYATWYRDRPLPMPRCVRWGPMQLHSPSPKKVGTAATTFRPMSIVAKQSPISGRAELLWILIKHEMIDVVAVASAGRWTICKSFAPCSRQITMLPSHHSSFSLESTPHFCLSTTSHKSRIFLLLPASDYTLRAFRLVLYSVYPIRSLKHFFTEHTSSSGTS